MLLISNFDLSEKIGNAVSYEVGKIYALFLKLKCSNFRLNSVKILEVIEIVKEIKFERVWDDLESETYFQRQSLLKY